MGFTDLSCVPRDPKTGRVPRPVFDPEYRFSTSELSRGYVYDPATGRASGLPPALDRRPFAWLSSPPAAKPVVEPDVGAIAAVHESSHAVCALAKNRRAVRVSIVSTPEHDGISLTSSPSLGGDDWKANLRDEIVVFVAGRVGERLHFGTANPLRSDHDYRHARAAGQLIVGGRDPHSPEVVALVAEAEVEAERILRARWDLVSAIALRLVERGELGEQELLALVGVEQRHVRRLELPLMHRAANVRAFDGDQHELSVTFTTGSTVRRNAWPDGAYDEQLLVGEANVDLERANSGSMPFLAAHASSSLNDVLGTVTSAHMENGQGVATIRMSRRPELAGVVMDLKDGILRGISVGYQYLEVNKTKRDGGEPPLWVVQRWRPLEISLVPIPADAGAMVCSSKTFACDLFE